MIHVHNKCNEKYRQWLIAFQHEVFIRVGQKVFNYYKWQRIRTYRIWMKKLSTRGKLPQERKPPTNGLPLCMQAKHMQNHRCIKEHHKSKGQLPHRPLHPRPNGCQKACIQKDMSTYSTVYISVYFSIYVPMVYTEKL